jgi:hypothetical protein
MSRDVAHPLRTAPSRAATSNTALPTWPQRRAPPKSAGQRRCDQRIDHNLIENLSHESEALTTGRLMFGMMLDRNAPKLCVLDPRKHASYGL